MATRISKPSIVKAARTRAVNDRIEEDVLAYLKGTKFYKNASDVGREVYGA